MSEAENATADRITVTVDADLEELIPGFLENRDEDLVALREALTRSDFEAIRLLGHSLKGVGGGYGFEAVSDLGRQIEDAAKERDAATIGVHTEELAGYLSRVEVVYEE
jgi:HPt (histidine-containing phosphotransfer) domain-containing protein